MRGKVFKKVGTIIVMLVMLLQFGNPIVSNAEEMAYSNMYAKEDSGARERYILGLAEKEGISFKKAEKEVEKMESSILRAQDEYVRYKTVDKTAGTFKDANRVIATVNIGVEVCYVYNRRTGRPVSIIAVGAPYAYVLGGSSGTFNHGGFNVVRESSSRYRISATGNVTMQTTMSISAGGDVVTLTEGYNHYVGTRSKTLSMYVNLSDG